MTLASPFSARLLVPLTLLSPYVFVLHYKISVVELVVFAYLLLVLAPAIALRGFALPRFLLVFLFLFTVGYFGALTNGVAFGVPIGVWNLNFFYKMALAIGAFCIGMRFRGEMSDIFRSRIVVASMLVLGALAVIYPFLSFDAKVRFFAIFYPQGSDFERYLTDVRMPGLGLNANVYAFIVYSYLIFSMRAFLDGKGGLVASLISLIVIFVLSSKLIIALAVGTCVFLIAWRSVRLRADEAGRPLLSLRRRGTSVGVAIVMIAAALVVAMTQTSAGQRVLDSYAAVKRFEAFLSQEGGVDEPYGLALRVHYWTRGLERASLAPVLGIAKDPFRQEAGTLIGFYEPHNEFLRMWLLYGLAGLAAWLYLIATLSYRNVREKTDICWLIFYASLVLFMIFDGGLDDPRVTTFLFLMIGLNWRSLRRRRDEAATRPAVQTGGALAS